MDRVPGYEPVGRRFESRQARQNEKPPNRVVFCFAMQGFEPSDRRMQQTAGVFCGFAQRNRRPHFGGETKKAGRSRVRSPPESRQARQRKTVDESQRFFQFGSPLANRISLRQGRNIAFAAQNYRMRQSRIYRVCAPLGLPPRGKTLPPPHTKIAANGQFRLRQFFFIIFIRPCSWQRSR